MQMLASITSDNILKRAASPGSRAVLRSAILKNAVLALIE